MRFAPILSACLALPVLPHLASGQGPGEPVVLHWLVPERLEVLSADRTLLWSATAQDADFPPGLSPSNAAGILDGRWVRDAYGNWFWDSPRHDQLVAAQGGAAGCLPFDPLTLTIPEPAGGLTFHRPGLADSQGNVWLLYEDDGPFDVYVVRSIGDTGLWDAPVLVGTGTQANPHPDMAIDASDEITVVHQEIVPGESRVRAVRYVPGSGWGASEIVATGTKTDTFDVTTAANGDVLLAYQAGPGGDQSVFFTRREHASGTWTPPVQVSPAGARAFNCTVRSSRDRTKHVIVYLDNAAGSGGLWSNHWGETAQAFSSPKKLPGSKNFLFGQISTPRLELNAVVESSGDVTVVYGRDQGGAVEGQLVANRWTGGAWQPPHVFFSGLPANGVQLTLDEQAIDVTPADEVLVALSVPDYSGPVGPQFDLHLANHRPGTGWAVTPSLHNVLLGIFQPPARTRAVVYQASRALATVNDNTTLLAFHYNGLEWSVDDVPIPQAAVFGHHLVATPGDALLADKLGGIRTSWMRGTTAFSNVGGALDGASGPPLLEGACDQVPGEPVTYTLSGAQPGAPAVLVVGFGRLDLPFLGGVLVPSPDISVPTAFTDASGVLQVGTTWPTGPSAGATFFYQYWIVDAGGPQGLAASNALAGVAP